MMDMGIGGLLGGVASGVFGYLGALENAEAQREATQANIWINDANIKARERERAEAVAMAKKLRAEQKLGFTDARGMRTQFVPGKGWVSTPSDTLKRLFELQEAEQLNVLTKDLPMARAVRERNYKRGLIEEGVGETYRMKLANLERTPARGDEAYQNDLYTAMTSGLRDAARQTGGMVFQQMFRTGAGNSNLAKVAAGMQDRTNRAYTNAALQAKLMSRGMGEREKNEQRMPLANLYNLFATRASQGATADYKPTDPLAGDKLGEAARNALVSGQDITKLLGAPGERMDYIQPNMGYGNALSALGSGIGSGLQAMGAGSRYANRGQQGGASPTALGFGPSGGYNSPGMYVSNENYDSSY